MANINQVKKKSIGLVRKILNRLDSLKLKKYYFECAVILMNSMLRPSILYACDMYYDMKESELRQLEQIEEGFLRKILKTFRGCPISQLYLEIGQTPARFEIQKMRLLYLKYILEQSEETLLRKFFQLQIEEPTKGDWGSQCVIDLKELEITETFDEIKEMSKTKFTRLLKSRIEVNALKYLKNKRKSKGKEIEYTELEMAEYLQPTNDKLSIEEKQSLFAIRNRMFEISSNFSKSNAKTLCLCGETENMKHIFVCEILNEEADQNELYENIYNGNIKQQLRIFWKFEENVKKREFLQNMNKKIKIETETPCDPVVIRCSVQSSNG